MLDRIVQGEVPRKHHIVLRDSAGALLHEECLTRDGFDGPYTILYHRNRPHTQRIAPATHGWQTFQRTAAGPPRLAKRHFKAPELPRIGGAPIDTRIPLLGNLFKDHKDNKTRKELIILIRPQAIRTGEDASQVAEQLRAKMRLGRNPAFSAPDALNVNTRRY